MAEIEINDLRISKAADLLEQIKSVDEMILLHEQKGNVDDLMLFQYKERRQRFLSELFSILQELNIDPSDFAA